MRAARCTSSPTYPSSVTSGSPVCNPMRTRIGPSASASRAASAAASASEAFANATKNESPSVPTSTPPWRVNSLRMVRRCSARRSAYSSPSSPTSRVEPSMSVNRSVTVPCGNDTSERTSSTIAAAFEPSARRFPTGVGEEDFSDTRRLLQSSEVSRVAKHDRLLARKQGNVGFTFGHPRPVAITVDERDGCSDPAVQPACGDHAVDVAEDAARHPCVAVPTADPAQLGQALVGQIAPVGQPTAQHDAEDGLVLHLRDHAADRRQPRTADVEGGNAIGPSDALWVVVGVDRYNPADAVCELG